jgi:hypothetical protein
MGQRPSLKTNLMAKADFLQQLQDLGLKVQELVMPPHTYFTFDYLVPVGRFEGQTVRLGLQAMDSFPMDAPPGPHIKPHLLQTTNQGGVHPTGGINNSPLGTDWQYWSRPFREWAKTDKNAKTYLAHIKNLLATV